MIDQMEAARLDATGHRLPVLDHKAALAAARAIKPRLRTRAERTDADRKLPQETIDELIDSGLFGITTPECFGGSGLGFDSLVQVATELSSGCGSSGWVYGVVAGHNFMVALLSEQAQREVFSNPRSLVSTVFRLQGTTMPEGDGYRLAGGEGRFCSGVDFADWVLVGNAVQREGRPPEPGFFLIPISDVEIVDDWFTAGMRGTGSRTIRIADAFVPAHRFVALADIQRGQTPGARFHGAAKYRLPFSMSQPFSLIGAPLGLAKGALEQFAASTGKRCENMPAEQIGEQSATFTRISQVAADVDAAITILMDNCRIVDDAQDPSAFTPLQRARLKRDMAYAAQKCRYAVTSLFEASGGSGIYDGSDLQRAWRDINGATAHVAFTWDTAASNYGRALAGLPPSKFTPV